MDHKQRRLLELFAQLLEYPESGLAGRAWECEMLLADVDPEASGHIASFRRFAQQVPIGRLREIYTAFFDLNPVCAPYLGYQLFGETYQRSVLILALIERYRAHEFEFNRSELPDRISVVMRYASTSGDDELVLEGLIPALRRMTGVGQDPSVDDQQEPIGSAIPQLEGHSHGGHLDEGVLLEMTEGISGSGRRAYEHLLIGIRLALEKLWLPPAVLSVGQAPEADMHDRPSEGGRI